MSVEVDTVDASLDLEATYPDNSGGVGSFEADASYPEPAMVWVMEDAAMEGSAVGTCVGTCGRERGISSVVAPVGAKESR